ncbi:YuiB family protein [Desmospora profundinema]|uniref:Xanthosine utilization system XapX-like protein n=1 Tax=Desmospora profundinema TaxID=1571184 RepID=A0ABU1IQV1_9BACL|nr:YuiB family protein [Desmospora profundinema]MDR6226319.1 xanthosine utilization system XapX-like protein [Desmospora profundinema]
MLLLPQYLISIPLFAFLAFGISFILNMILKTTWLPVILYVGLVGVLIFRMEQLKNGDYLMLTVGLIGILIGSWVIQYLRKQGYRMF